MKATLGWCELLSSKRNISLVGGFIPSEKYESIGMIIPNIWENKTCSKPPTSSGKLERRMGDLNSVPSDSRGLLADARSVPTHQSHCVHEQSRAKQLCLTMPRCLTLSLQVTLQKQTFLGSLNLILSGFHITRGYGASSWSHGFDNWYAFGNRKKWLGWLKPSALWFSSLSNMVW